MKKPLKYRNCPVEVDGIRFASKAEARRYGELKMLKAGRKIEDLELQPRFKMLVGPHKICTYVGDFSYYDPLRAVRIVEDVKGTPTPVFRIKEKLFRALYPDIELRVIS